MVTARRAGNLFSEVEGALGEYRGHRIEGTLAQSAAGALEGFFTVELDSREDLRRIGKALRQRPNLAGARQSLQVAAKRMGGDPEEGGQLRGVRALPSWTGW